MKRIGLILLALLFFLCCAYPSRGSCMTATATPQSITIPMQQWQNLKNELTLLNSDLEQCRIELNKIKKPSKQLLEELAQAQDSLSKLQSQLEEQKNDLNLLSGEVSALKELSQTLKQQIDKERRIHRRQIWQNRVWCIVGGAAIGFAVGRANK